MSERKNTRLPTASVAGARRKPYKRRFSNYLLNKSLQLRYMAFVAVLSAILSSTLGYMIWKQESIASSTIVDAVGRTLCDTPEECEELKAEIGGELSSRDTNLVWRMVAIGVGLVVVLVLYLLIMTHKVAGPLYKVSMYFDRMAEGQLSEVYPLRKGDMLQDFYNKFKEMHEAVRARHQRDNELVSRFIKACDDAGVERQGELGTRLDELEEHHKNRTEALA